jgi:ATP-binding cassette subfamily B protein
MKALKEYMAYVATGIRIIHKASHKYFHGKLICSILMILMPFAPVYFFGKLLNAFSSQSDASTIAKIATIAALYLASILVERVVTAVSKLITHKYDDCISVYLDNLIIDKVVDVKLEFFETSDLNDTLSNSWSLVFSIQNIVWMLFGMFCCVSRLILSLALIVNLNPLIALVVIAFSVPLVLFDKSQKERDRTMFQNNANNRRKVEYYKELFFDDTRKEIRLFGLYKYFTNIYKGYWKQLYNDQHSKNKKDLFQKVIGGIAVLFSEIIVYATALRSLLNERIAVGDVVYYTSIVAQFRNDFTELCNTINVFTTCYNEIKDVRAFIDSTGFVEKCGTRELNEKPTIEFKNVSFMYPGSADYILNDCSFRIESGEKIALVGLNGSGKSTIVKLMLRLYDASEGDILINDISIREYDLVSLRKAFGVLFQEILPYCFSVRLNVGMSDIPRSDSDADIIDACRQAEIYDIIEPWKKGIDEEMTRAFDVNGKELSQGQWQRVALARAFFRDAPFALLDEPSASLDPIAEHDIFTKFSQLSDKKSALLISHRLSSITLADRILVLEDGRIIEQGTHNQLLKQNGQYAYLFNLQASKYMNSENADDEHEQADI